MRVFKVHKPPFRGVAYLPGGKTLAVAHQCGLVTLWDLESGTRTASLEARKNLRTSTNRLAALAISPDGRLLAAAGESLTVWDTRTNEPVAGFAVPVPLALSDAAFAMKGTRLVASLQHGWNYHPDAPVVLAMWDTAIGTEIPIPWSARGRAGSLAVSPDGQSIFADVGYEVLRWHLPTEQEHTTQFRREPCSLAASPAGFVAQGTYRMVEIRDATGDRLLARWEAHAKGVFALAFSRDGRLLATGSGDELVKVWDVSAVAAVLADLDAPPLERVAERSSLAWDIGPVRALAFSPDGLTAAAVGDRARFVVWDVDG